MEKTLSRSSEINLSDLQFELNLDIVRIFAKVEEGVSFLGEKLSNFDFSFLKNREEYQIYLFVHKLSVFLLEVFEQSLSKEAALRVIKKGYQPLCDDIVQSNTVDVNLLVDVIKLNLGGGKKKTDTKEVLTVKISQNEEKEDLKNGITLDSKLVRNKFCFNLIYLIYFSIIGKIWCPN